MTTIRLSFSGIIKQGKKFEQSIVVFPICPLIVSQLESTSVIIMTTDVENFWGRGVFQVGNLTVSTTLLSQSHNKHKYS